MKKTFNQFLEFNKTISNIKNSHITNLNFINYVKNQINQALLFNTITYEEHTQLIINLKAACFFIGITI